MVGYDIKQCRALLTDYSTCPGLFCRICQSLVRRGIGPSLEDIFTSLLKYVLLFLDVNF